MVETQRHRMKFIVVLKEFEAVARTRSVRGYCRKEQNADFSHCELMKCDTSYSDCFLQSWCI